MRVSRMPQVNISITVIRPRTGSGVWGDTWEQWVYDCILLADNNVTRSGGDGSIHFYNSHDKTIPMILKWPGQPLWSQTFPAPSRISFYDSLWFLEESVSKIKSNHEEHFCQVTTINHLLSLYEVVYLENLIEMMGHKIWFVTILDRQKDYVLASFMTGQMHHPAQLFSSPHNNLTFHQLTSGKVGLMRKLNQ